MTKQPKLRVHRCRREFLAVKEELFSLYKEGYSIRAIWEYFTESKKITMAYTSFTMLVKEPDNPKPFRRSKNAEDLSEPKQPSTIKVNKQANFSHHKTPFPINHPRKKETN